MKIFIEVMGEGIKKDTPIEVKVSTLKEALIGGKTEETLCIREDCFEVSRFLILDATENTLVSETVMTFEELAMFAWTSISAEADRISRENYKLIILNEIADRIVKAATNEPDNVEGFTTGIESEFAYYISEKTLKKNFGDSADLSICSEVFNKCLISSYAGVRYLLFDSSNLKLQIKSDEFENIEDTLRTINVARGQLEYINRSIQAGDSSLMLNLNVLNVWKGDIVDAMKTHLNYRVKEVSL